MLEVKGITGGYHGTPVIHDLSFSVKRGEFLGILGPNGSGKTTLLKLLTGLLPLDHGSVILDERNIQSYGSRQRAKMIAVLPQWIDPYFNFTVREFVTLGRYPYQKGLFRTLTDRDRTAVACAMKQTEVEAFANQPIRQLSGGEQQRVYLAQSLAQEPQLLCLDEPTNHLDINHQKGLLDHLRKWKENDGQAVVAIFHDLNLACLYCDQVLLLKKGRMATLGSPADVLTEEWIRDVYDTKMKRLSHPKWPHPVFAICSEEDNENMKMYKKSQSAWK